MPLTSQQKVKINEKLATMPQALQRDLNVDYCHGWFFVTLNTRENAPVLSTCEGNPRIADGMDGAPHCLYSELGVKVKECWQLICKFHPDVVVDACEVMPEHFHGLLYLPPTNKKHLGKIIYGFMVGCTHAYWDFLGIDWRSMTNDSVIAQQSLRGEKRESNAIASQWQDRDHTRSYRGPALFVHGYNDMEPITAEEVDIKRAYIKDQARKRLIQGDRHNCFRKYRHQHSHNWNLDRVMLAINADKTFCNSQTRCAIAQKNITERLNHDDRGIGLDYIGDKALFFSKRKLPLVCHRTDAWLFDKQKEMVLKAAREGAVIVSAFISQKEREIKQQLMIKMLPFIEIVDNGLSDKYKGVGKAFYALAENRLVQITPWTYIYQKDGQQVSREMCLVMNELARVISGAKDDWWK